MVQEKVSKFFRTQRNRSNGTKFQPFYVNSERKKMNRIMLKEINHLAKQQQQKKNKNRKEEDEKVKKSNSIEFYRIEQKVIFVMVQTEDERSSSKNMSIKYNCLHCSHITGVIDA